jgi:GT2 family glycosyltransferase
MRRKRINSPAAKIWSPEVPRVSIVAPSLNSGRFISAMIESVLNQDYPNLELVVQDGASVDNTLQVLQQYPVRWDSAPDEGTAQALNRAIAASSGDIIGFLCCDDRLEPDSVPTAVAAFEADPSVALVYGDCYVHDSVGRKVSLGRSRPFDEDDFYWGDYIAFAGAYIRRSLLDQLGGFDESLKILNDYDLWLRCGRLLGAGGIRYIPCPLASHYGTGSQAHALSQRDPQRRVVEWRTVRMRLLKSNLDKVRQPRALAGLLVQTASDERKSGHRTAALHTLLQAIRLYPPTITTRPGIVVAAQIPTSPLVTRAVGGVYRRAMRMLSIQRPGARTIPLGRNRALLAAK